MQIQQSIVFSLVLGMVPLTTLEASWLDSNRSIMDRLPESIDYASVSVPIEAVAADKHFNASLAKVSARAAAGIVLSMIGGTVVEVELTGESGYLVWAVETQMQDSLEHTILVDAGNGRILAARASEDLNDDCGCRSSSHEDPHTGAGQKDRDHWWRFW